VAICAGCGNDVPAGSRFCNACGAPLAETAPSREQRKVVTILFCDVTGSTELGEKLDPEALRALLARYFERMKEIVESHGGTVEKFIGDAVMAVFGIPTLHEDDALRALRAAREMVEAFPMLGVQGRIGVMTGEVVTGTEERLATGDAVNVAARLEQTAAPGEVLLGEETLRLTRDAVEVEAVEPLVLKGKSEAFAAYRLLVVRPGEGFARQLDAPMVGRATELRRLRNAYDQAVQDGSCQLFSILGSAGVGKSRLTAELVAGLDGARVVRGRCLPYGEGITYWPVVEVIKQLGDIELTGSPADAIRGLLDDTPGVVADEIAWGFRKLLEAAAAERPVVCVFDDVHWGEPTFLELVEHVADLSRSAPILLLCIARPELLDFRPSWGGGKLNSSTVLLEPLGPQDTDLLIASLGELEGSLRTRIRDAAEGNPLFVEQMVALLRESGDGEVVVPPTIQALLAARLDQLEVSERGVLEAGSVEGRLFHRGAVQALTPEESQVSTRLTALVRKELVRPDNPQLPGEDAFRFRHLLIRDAAYDALPKSVRSDLHERFADWLETHGADLVEVDELLGYHLEQACAYRTELGLPAETLADRAREYLGRAGRRALERIDGASVRLFERAVALLPVGAFDANLELDLCDALFFDGRPAESEARAASLAERAGAAGDRVAMLRAQLRRADAHTHVDSTVSIDELARLVETARPELEEASDPYALYDLWATAATVAHGLMQNSARLEAAERAANYARLASDERRARRVLPFLVTSRFYGPTPAAEALAWCEELEADGVSHPALSAHRAQFMAMLGRFDEARAVHSALREHLSDRGLATPVALNLGIAGEIEWLAGDVAAAVTYLRESCEQLEAMGHLGWLSTSIGQLGRYVLELGDLDEAERLARRSEELGADDDVATQIIWRRVCALVLARRGDLENADVLAREAVRSIALTDSIELHAATLMDLAEVQTTSGNAVEAMETLERATQLFERKGNLVMTARARERLAAYESVSG